jgi:uncharacterized RDD family membrane protein YckC
MSVDQARPNPYAPPQAEVSDVPNNDAELERAGRGIRLGAAVIDSLIPGIIFLPWLIGIGFDFSGVANGTRAPFTFIGLAIAGIGSLAWIGITLFFVHRNGQTIAKRLLGIKVVRSDGSRASLGRIFWLRNFVNALPSAIPLIGNAYPLIDSLFIFGEKQQCLLDLIADTIVVKAQ